VKKEAFMKKLSSVALMTIGRHTVSDVSVTLKMVEVTATRQRERRLKSNQFD